MAEATEKETRDALPVPFREAEAELDRILIRYCLVDSLRRHIENARPYPFVDMRELKPGAAGSGLPESEVLLHNNGLVLLVDGTLPAECKKHIRFKEKNRVLKENLMGSKVVPEELLAEFEVAWTRSGEGDGFERLLRTLIRADFALLVQRDRRTQRQHRYALSHFRVRIDWPVVEAVESLAKELRYLDRHLYEHSEQEAEQLEGKFFERFGFHHTVGGRRTASIVGAQYLRRISRRRDAGLDFRVYVGSAEARTLTRIEPDRVRRFALVHLTESEIAALELPPAARTTHVVHQDSDGSSVFVLEVGYVATDNARPSKTPRSTDNLAQLPFLRIEEQVLRPRDDAAGAGPIPVSLVYRPAE